MKSNEARPTLVMEYPKDAEASPTFTAFTKIVTILQEFDKTIQERLLRTTLAFLDINYEDLQ